MDSTPTKPVKLFYCYAREDQHLLGELKKHLSTMRQGGIISSWDDQEIMPGEESKQAINANLQAADIVLLLISPDFLSSGFCYGVEMQHALERHARDEISIVPIILRPVYWEGTPFSQLKALPSDDRPVTAWSSLDAAYTDIASNLHKLIDAHREKSAVVEQVLSTDETKQILQEYLTLLGQKYERLSFAGIPAGLIRTRIKIEHVFIPLLLRPIANPGLNTYGISDEELAAIKGQFEQKQQYLERERFLKEAAFERGLRQLEAIELADLWGRLTRENPAAVIQGYPGMGKSTLLTYLTLYMTRSLAQRPEPAQFDLDFAPLLIPIFVSLKEFADKIESNTYEKSASDLPLLKFIQDGVAKDFRISPALLTKWLADGSCLVLLDGLDEVSSQLTRSAVQKAIREFIDEQKYAEKGLLTYNRFLITSRVAGYDQQAFPDYDHYLLAELTVKQIESFLPRWCRANALRNLSDVSNEAIELEAKDVEQKLLRAIRNNRGLRVLAENPFLLTLLAAMQQNGTELPSSRAELYKAVTTTLLKGRNEAKGITPLPEAEAIQRLGPLAYKMHGEENSIAREQVVLAAIEEAIHSPQGGGGSEEVVKAEARDYLERLSRRGGLFVKRTGGFYGFFHRTFEEYFAALYMLKLIESERNKHSNKHIGAFIKKVRQENDLWREPYLLAVALKSREDGTLATLLIRKLFQTPKNAKSALHDLLLATNAVIESEAETIDRALQQEIAEKLIQTYEQAQRNKRIDDCNEIEKVMSSWLLSLSKEAYMPPVLQALEAAIRDSAHPTLQRAALTLLTMIGQQLTEGSPIIFRQLVPPLLALAGLPAIDPFQPASDLSTSTNIDVVDLALTALSFMGEHGPAGAQLVEVRRHFKDHEQQLRLLARYSLESGILITPVVPLSSDEDYQRYESAIEQWIRLRDHYKEAQPVTEQDIDACLEIHKTLLDCAREARYPIATLLLDLLDTGMNVSTSWQQAWKEHLLAQLDTGHYLNYQQIVLLWAMLFPQKQEIEILTSHILNHFNGPEITVRRNAEYFISSLSMDFRDSSFLSDSVVLRVLRYLRVFRVSTYFIDLRVLRYFIDSSSLSDLSDLSDLRSLRSLRLFSDSSSLSDSSDSSSFRYLRYLRYFIDSSSLSDLSDSIFLGNFSDSSSLRQNLLTREAAERARQSVFSGELTRDTNMLKILLGRILQIRESEASDNNIKNEVQDIATSAKDRFRNDDDDEVKDAALDILRYLPAHSADEIRIVIQLAEDATDGDLRQAYATSLIRAEPGKDDADAWKELAAARKSHADEVRQAAEYVFKQPKRK